MKNKLFNVLHIVLIIGLSLTFLCQTVQSAMAETTDFAGGTGTEIDPYLVANAEQLDNIRNVLGSYFKLTADINLGVSPWNEGEGWSPLGTSSAPFTGTLDGDGFVIFNLTVERPDTNYQGLFGYLDDAEVRDLRLVNINVLGDEYSGGLAGFAENSTLKRLSVFGEVAGSVRYTGGLVGSQSGGVLERSRSEVDVIGADQIGGLVGRASSDAQISQSYSLGTVEGTTNVGGLVGYLYDGTLTDSFAHGSVTGDEYVGGLAGNVGQLSYNYGYVSHSYSTGLVTGSETASDVGGFVGRIGAGAVYGSYWDIETSGQSASAGGTGLSTTMMKKQGTFTNWNFNTLWRIDDGNYPSFQDLGSYEGPIPPEEVTLTGEGTEASPYILTNADELNAMRQNLAAHYQLGNDIDLTAAVVWNGGLGWEPVGTSSTPFTGSLDGAGFAISNLVVNRPNTDVQGLFGYLDGAEVRNLALVDINVYGKNTTGGLVGQANSSTLTGLIINGVVSNAGNNYTGGLVGYQFGGVLERGRAAVNVIGQWYIGGLVGYASSDAQISQSYSLGAVAGTTNVGGLVGYLYDGTLTDSFAHGSVMGDEYVGGLAGNLGMPSYHAGYVSHSYSTGLVTGSDTASYVGGLVGRITAGAVGYSFWDRETSAQSTSAGGTGKTTAEMRQQGTFTNWNFNTLWRIDEGVDYPTFQDLSPYKGPGEVDLSELDGTGTESDPYILTSADELNTMRQNLAAHYQLENGIDLSGSVVWNGGLGWEPIGTSEAAFTGSLDGAGFTISNLVINRPSNAYTGLFGYLDGAEVRDLVLVDINIYGRSYTGTGGLAGYAVDSTIADVAVIGMVTGNSYTGGLVGYQSGGLLEGIRTAVHVVGYQYTGGLAGRADGNTQISQSYSLGAVEGRGSYTGGLVGYFDDGTITNSYSQAPVMGIGYVGGLIGRISGTDSYVYRSYSTGYVTGTSNVGGLVGSGATVNDSYWDIDASGMDTSAGGTGKTTAEMKQQGTFRNWNFNTLWRIDEGVDYPTFQDLSPYKGPGEVDLSELDGTGTESDPYILTSADELNTMRQNLAAHYQLGNDIDLSGSVVWNGGLGWEPIGTSEAAFTGSLDGAGFTISNLVVNRPRNEYTGLFGYLNGAEVRDLALVDINIYGRSYTGGLAGYAVGSTIADLAMIGIVTGNNYTGSLVGYQSGGVLEDSRAAVHVVGNQYTGGLAGRTDGDAQISQSYSLGTVEGTGSYTGGLVGYLYDGTITDSFSQASVTGTSTVGGLTGRLYGSGSYGAGSYIDRSYSTGLVTGTSNVGGLVGLGATVNESYWDIDASGMDTSAGGTGKTTAQMQQQETFENWDFTTVWDIEEDESYPFHQANPGFLALDFTTRYHPNMASSGHAFDVISNLSWTATTSDGWITIAEGGSGLDNGSVTYNLDENLTANQRTGTITVSDGGSINRVFRIQQSGRILEIHPGSRSHDAAASSGHSIQITGNVDWTAAASDTWIVLTSAASGTGSGSITYRLTENLALTGREGNITISGWGITHTYTVVQAAAEPYCEIDHHYAEYGHQASSGNEIAISANQAWSAAASESWITLTNASGSGDGTLTYNIDENLNRKSRTGYIVISAGDRTINFRVTQALAWLMSVDFEPAEGGFAIGTGAYGDGDTVTLNVTPNTGYTFTNWTEDGVEVSTNAEYSFNAQRSRSLVANFSTSSPMFTSEAETSATQDVLYTYNITAEDSDDGDVLTITAEPKPEWLNFTDNGDGTASLIGTPTNAEVGDHDVVLTVTDLTSETDTQEFTITVTNVKDAPEFISDALTEATQDVLYEYEITTTDPDLVHGDELTITAEPLPGWLSLTDYEDGTATLSGTPTNADVGDHDVMLRVTDLTSESVTQEFTITVFEAPVTGFNLYLPLIVR